MNEIAENAMSSLDLVNLINVGRQERAKATGKPYRELLHKNFLARIENHPGIDSANFLAQYKDSTGRILKCYDLPKRESELMVMSESLEVQTKVLDRLRAVEKKLQEITFQQEIARVREEMLANQPLDIMSWLQPESFLWLGEPGQATMERRYFAVLEAHTIGYPAAARKYGVSYEMMQEWMEEMDSRRLRTFGHTLTRFNSWLALKYAADMRVHQAKEVARVAQKKLDRANKRLQRLANTK